MALIQYSDGIKYHMDTKLKLNLEKLKHRLQRKDADYVLCVDGSEGSGKSVLALQIAKFMYPQLSVDDICMNAGEFTKRVMSCKDKTAIVFDEAFTGLSSRMSLTDINNGLVSLMMEMRQKNLFVVVVLPTFFLLDKYVALFRARGLIHVYVDKRGKRGQYIFFNQKKKKLLYLYGKKLMTYRKPPTRFNGRFFDIYAIDEDSYRDKKRSALMMKERRTKAEVYHHQRDALIKSIYEELGIDDKLIAHFLRKHKVKDLKELMIKEIITDYDKKWGISKKDDELLNDEGEPIEKSYKTGDT